MAEVAHLVDLKNLQKTTVFFIGKQVKVYPHQFQKAISPEYLGTRNRPVVLVEDEEDINEMATFIYVDLGIDLIEYNISIMTFENAGLDPNRINGYLDKILGIDDINCIPLTPTKLELHPELKEAERRG